MTMSFGDALVDRFLGCLVAGQVNEENVKSGFTIRVWRSSFIMEILRKTQGLRLLLSLIW
jgi:hypothetical protein